MIKLMAANWKMYKTRPEASDTARDLVKSLEAMLPDDREVLVFPPFTALYAVGEAFKGRKNFSWGAQNFYPKEEGAYTGEISPRMLAELGCTYLLTGHSERRHVFGESDGMVADKTSLGLAQGFRVVMCIGETIEERRGDKVEEILKNQLDKGLSGVDKSLSPEQLSIAYEPVWAIGTGEVARLDDIVQAHSFIRQQLGKAFGERGQEMRILYGGSVKPDNASEILGLDNVDGVLVGGASLKADSFSRIVLA
jgi:triosephosphate isomerase